MPSKSACRRHPRHEVIGVCALCLKERLLVLMMEEEDLENAARDSFYSSSCSLDQASSSSYNMQDSPPHTDNYLPRDVSPYHQAFNIFTDNCKAGCTRSSNSASSRRHGMEYDREDVRQVADLYLQRQHSLSPSSQLQKQSIMFPSPILTSQQDQPIELINSSFRPDFARIDRSTNTAATARKKRGYLWSLLNQRPHGGESGNSSMAKDSNQLELHRRSSLDSMFPRTLSQTEPQGGRFSNEHHKLLHPRFMMKGAHDILSSKDNASPPTSFRSKQASGGGASSHVLSPAAVSRLRMAAPPLNPLHRPAKGQNTHVRNAGDDTISKLRRELFAEAASISRVTGDGISAYKACQKSDHLQGSKSWMSSILFPRKDKLRPKEVTINPATYYSAGDSINVHATTMPSQGHSVNASPELTKTPRRKSVSFLDDHVAARTSRDNNNRSEANSPHLKPQNQANLTRLGELHRVKSSNSALQDNGNARTNLYTLSIDEQLMKSPRIRLASLLPKRRSMGYMDCTRDMRVSPAPISLQEISRQSQHLHSPESGPKAPASVRRLSSELHHHHHHHDTVVRIPSCSPSKLQRPPSSRNYTTDAELEDVDAMINAQYLADCKSLNNVSATPKPSKGWSPLAWSKALSPMLGLRGKRKKKKKSKEQSCSNMNNQYISHHDHLIESRESDRSEIKLQIENNCNDYMQVEHDSIYSAFDEIPVIRGSQLYNSIAPNIGQESNCQSLPSLIRLRKELARKGGIKKPNESAEMVYNCTSDEKRPPQHEYSFLSKDYSAFSFFFSPARSSSGCSSNNNIAGSINDHGSSRHNMMMMMMQGDHEQSRRASVSSSTATAADYHDHDHIDHDQLQHQQLLNIRSFNGQQPPPPRHSVDGASWTSYPSLFKHSSNGR